MWSLSLVMSECSLSGRGQGHVSNFYIVDLENFATASRRYTGDIHNSTVVGLFMTSRMIGATRSRHGWVHMFITHRPTLTLQLHNFDLFRTCRTSSFSTVAWKLARFQLTQRIARSLGDSWASCQNGSCLPSWIFEVQFLTVWVVKRPSLHPGTKFRQDGQTVAEISRFCDFSRWRPPPSWIFKNSKF